MTCECLIVVPCFNEAARLDTEAVQRFVTDVNEIDLLFVDDGSTDATPERLEQLRQFAPERIRVRSLTQNMGKAEAVRQGLLEAFLGLSELDRSQPPRQFIPSTRAPYIQPQSLPPRPPAQRFAGFLDADLSTPLQALPQFLDVLRSRPEIQMVFGTRVPLLGRCIVRDRRRQFLGRVFARAASAALGVRIYDTQCGAKVFRVGPETAALFRSPFSSRWIFDVELVARWISRQRALGGPQIEGVLYELPLEQWREVSGSKVRPRDFLRAVWELAVIYRRYLLPAERRTGAAARGATRQGDPPVPTELPRRAA